MSTQLPETFDPTTQEGNSWDVLPVGEYVAQVVESSVQQPNSGDGYQLALTWKIIEGDYEGRQVWRGSRTCTPVSRRKRSAARP